MSHYEPLEALNEFFSNFTLPEAREIIDTLLEVAVTSDNDQYSTAKERDSAYQFCKQLHQLLKASHLLNSKAVKIDLS